MQACSARVSVHQLHASICAPRSLPTPLRPLRLGAQGRGAPYSPMAGGPERRALGVGVGPLDNGPSVPDCFSAADYAFLRAMALRPRLPEGNISWDDAVVDRHSISSWHAEAWTAWGVALEEQELTVCTSEPLGEALGEA